MKAYDLTYLMRRIGLLVLAALGVHQLRYLIAYGSDSAGALDRQGHGYLTALLPDLVGIATVLIVATLAATAISRSARSRRGPHGPPAWLLCSISILAIFALQELAEGFAASGHPAGLAALFANGGWVAAPLAALFGALVALALRLLDSADQVLGTLAEQRDSRRSATPPQSDPVQHFAAPLAQLALAFGFARRPPPSALRSI